MMQMAFLDSVTTYYRGNLVDDDSQQINGQAPSFATAYEMKSDYVRAFEIKSYCIMMYNI